MVKCPSCGIEVSELHAVPHDIAARLQASGVTVPSEVCLGCISDMRGTASKTGGGALLAQERAKDQHRMTLWKSRVQLIRKARMMMNEKNYSEAAVAYEKYIKILELVFGCKKGELLTPDMFKDNARTSELTVVASVYWDLLRIYDTSSKYGERQDIAAKQLAVFVRFTPVFPDIIKKAEAFAKSAKHPAKIRAFLRAAAKQRPRCFVATSAFESPLALEVQLLRHWRDARLRKTRAGRALIGFYYAASPALARFLDRHPSLKPATRAILRFVLACID